MQKPSAPKTEGIAGQGVMIKSILTVAAALIGAAIITLPGLAPQVQARAPAFGVKGDRVDARPTGTACSQHEWPYFEVTCLRDGKNPFGEAHQVRIVAIDRLLPLADAARQ
jgi:hypothetical protein